MITDQDRSASSPDSRPGCWTVYGWYDRDGRTCWFPVPVILPASSLRAAPEKS